MAHGALLRTDDRCDASRDTVSALLRRDGPRRRFGVMMSGLGIRYDLGAGLPLFGRRVPGRDLVTADGSPRVFRLLHDARRLLLKLDGPGGFDIGPWVDRVPAIDAAFAGAGEFPIQGQVAVTAAMPTGPDGSAALAGDGTVAELVDALTTWFGSPRRDGTLGPTDSRMEERSTRPGDGAGGKPTSVPTLRPAILPLDVDHSMTRLDHGVSVTADPEGKPVARMSRRRVPARTGRTGAIGPGGSRAPDGVGRERGDSAGSSLRGWGPDLGGDVRDRRRAGPVGGDPAAQRRGVPRFSPAAGTPWLFLCGAAVGPASAPLLVRPPPGVSARDIPSATGRRCRQGRHDPELGAGRPWVEATFWAGAAGWPPRGRRGPAGRSSREGVGSAMRSLCRRQRCRADHAGANAAAKPTPLGPNHDCPRCRSHPASGGRGVLPRPSRLTGTSAVRDDRSSIPGRSGRSPGGGMTPTLT